MVNKDGREVTTLCENGVHYTREIAPIVARAFIHQPEQTFRIRHKDNNKLNNKVDNLEWVVNPKRIMGYV